MIRYWHMLLSSDDGVVVVHPGLRSDRIDLDLHSVDAGASSDIRAGDNGPSGHIPGIKYIRSAIGRIRAWAGKTDWISYPAQAIAAVQHTIYFGEISWRS